MRKLINLGTGVCFAIVAFALLIAAPAAAAAPPAAYDVALCAPLRCGDEPKTASGTPLPDASHPILLGETLCSIARWYRAQGYVVAPGEPVTAYYLWSINKDIIPDPNQIDDEVLRLRPKPDPALVEAAEARRQAEEARRDAAAAQAVAEQARRDAAAAQAVAEQARRDAARARAETKAATDLNRWMLLGLAIVGLLIGVIALRGLLGRLSPNGAARALVPIGGFVIGLLYTPAYALAGLVAAFATSLGVGKKDLFILPFAGIVGSFAGLGFLLLARRWGIRPRALILALLVLAAGGWIGMFVAPNRWMLFGAAFAAGVSFAAGPVLMSAVATVEQVARATAKGVTGRLFRYLLFTLVGLTSGGAYMASRGLLDVLLVGLAGAALVALMFLGPLLRHAGVQAATALPSVRELVRDTRLFQAVTLGAISVGALIPSDSQIVFILGQQGHGAVWAGATFLAVLIGGLLGPAWEKAIDKWGLLVTARLATGLVLAGLVLWAVGIYLGGVAWIVLFSIAFAAMETGDTFNWVAASKVAVEDARDFGRSAMVLLPRLLIRSAFAGLAAYVATQIWATEAHLWWVGIPALAAMLWVVLLWRRGVARNATPAVGGDGDGR